MCVLVDDYNNTQQDRHLITDIKVIQSNLSEKYQTTEICCEQLDRNAR